MVSFGTKHWEIKCRLVLYNLHNLLPYMGNLATKSNMFVFHTYWGCIPSYWGNYYCFTVYASIKIHKLVKKSRSIMASAAKPGVVCQIQSSEPYNLASWGSKHIFRALLLVRFCIFIVGNQPGIGDSTDKEPVGLWYSGFGQNFGANLDGSYQTLPISQGA